MFGDESESDTESEKEGVDDKNECIGFKQQKKSLCPNIDISHITQHEFDHVIYQPGSDSFLLMDCIENDGKLFDEIFANESIHRSKINVLEIGCGSGIVLCHTYNVLKAYCLESMKKNKLSIALFGVDINENALKVTKNTLMRNGIKQSEFTLLQCDLLSGINIQMIDAQIDILIFNPPYVPTTNEELCKSQNEKSLSAAWSGGIDGRIVIDKFIQKSNFYKILAKKSFFYLVTIAMNKPDEIMDFLKQSPFNLNAQIVAKKRVVQEMLIIIKFTTVAIFKE